MSNMNNSDATIVIPCRNEHMTINSIAKNFIRKGYSILIPIAKNSDGKTEDICKKENFPYFIDSGNGKGAALREAIENVRTKYIIFVDADGSHDLNDVQMLLQTLEKTDADIVIASRLQGGSLELYDGTLESFFRTFFTICINQIINIRFGTRITDSQNGFRGGKSESFRSLGLKSKKFEVETEMVMKALKNNMKISEFPSREYPRKFGGSGISLWRHGWRYLFCVLRNIF